MKTRPIDILLAEDNPADARLTIRSLKGLSFPITVSTARNGEEAMAFLRREEPFASACPPDLVLLDLNMPRKDGHEVLAEMRSDPVLNLIPVLILTSSKSEADVRRSYSLHANAYVVKPTELHAYDAVIKAIEDFWLRRALLPTLRGPMDGVHR